MARARSKIELSLFPFLNILFSLIGVLILFIFMMLVMGRASGRARIQAGVLQGRAAARDNDHKLDAVAKRKADLEAQFERKNQELQRLRHEHEQLAQLLALRSRQDLMPAVGTGTVGVPIGAPAPKEWRIIPIDKQSGDNRKRPVLVQVTADQYVVYVFDSKGSLSKKTVFPAIGSGNAAPPVVPKRGAAARPGERRPGQRNDQRNGERQPATELVEFLDGINRVRRDKYLLFLIQPDGIEAFERIKEYCVGKYTTPLSKTAANVRPAELFDFGFEPFSADWLLIREAPKDSH